MENWIIWLVASIVLLIIELLTQTIWALCLSIGCAVSILSSFIGLDLNGQLVVLVISTIATYVILGILLKRNNRSTTSKINTRTGMDALLGRKAIVTNEIKPGHLGRARIDGDNWQVRAPGVEMIIPKGTEVYVTGYDSIILDVAIH